MTKRMNPEERKAYLAGMLRGIVYSAAAIATAFGAPKALKALDSRLQDADYAEEHAQVREIEGILAERHANDLKSGIIASEPDSFEKGLKKELDYRKKRHAREKKNAECPYCDRDPL